MGLNTLGLQGALGAPLRDTLGRGLLTILSNIPAHPPSPRRISSIA
jgi:hypothetical protein